MKISKIDTKLQKQISSSFKIWEFSCKMQEIAYGYNQIILITKVELINQVNQPNGKLVIIAHQAKQNPFRIATIVIIRK